MYGIQKARIESSFINMKENGTIDICHKVTLAGGETAYAHTYITERSAGIARAQLKKCGYMADNLDLTELDANALLLKGNEVEVDYFLDPNYNNKPKCEIVIERPKADANKLKAATEWLRNAKKQHDDAPPAGEEEGDIPF